MHTLVRVIDRSLCLARAAGTATTRESYLGIARLNFTALRKLTHDFTLGVTPECRRLQQAFEERDPWNFGVLRMDTQAS